MAVKHVPDSADVVALGDAEADNVRVRVAPCGRLSHIIRCSFQFGDDGASTGGAVLLENTKYPRLVTGWSHHEQDSDNYEISRGMPFRPEEVVH